MTPLPGARDVQASQLRLFDREEHQPLPADSGSSHFNDPSFAGNKTLPVHRWVPWIAGFSADFVRDVVSRYMSHNGVVLDPFAGIGTTLVEAVASGHDAVGFEINPYAVLACRAKIDAHRIRVGRLQAEMLRFRRFYDEKVATDCVPRSSPPKGFKTRSAFYSPRVLRKVLILQDFVDTIEDCDVRDLFRLAFASTMVRYSNYSYEPSLGRRVSAGRSEIQDFPVGEKILSKLSEIAEDISWLQERPGIRESTARIVHDSFFKYEAYLEPESVDLVVTSPPYLNNYHYNRNTRPHLYWLGYVEKPQDFGLLEHSNFGKYWQTVREQEAVELDFDLPNTDLAEKLEMLRTIKPERGIYGGKGWANYAATYFNDCHRFSQGIKYSLKPGGVALVVIGNSILQGVPIATDLYVGRIAECVGLELVRIDVPRATRVGNSIIQSDVRVVKARDTHQLYEAIVELRKP